MASLLLVVTIAGGCFHMTMTKHTLKIRRHTPKTMVKWSMLWREPHLVWVKNHGLMLQRDHRHHYHGRHRKPPVVQGPSTLPSMSEHQFMVCVISRESGGNPKAYNASSGAGGLFQFLLSTWDGLGFGKAYPKGAQTAPASVQYQAFYKAYAESGTSPWAPYDGC